MADDLPQAPDSVVDQGLGPAEVLDLRDVDALIRLVVAVAREP